ncbi:hypothetical protein QUF63_08785 [Anaerolineales bacterium HSG25]|nr:hypothetical protein [Anaerolineales bacterium HSG25]
MTQTLELTLDEQNRLIIPTILEQHWHLKPGMQLVIETDKNGRLYIRLPVAMPQLVNKEGVFVVQAELVGDIEQVINQDREQRIQTVAGALAV